MIRDAHEDISLTKIAAASIRLSNIAPVLHDLATHVQQYAEAEIPEENSAHSESVSYYKKVARELSENSTIIRNLSESLLLSVGRFRMPAHFKAKRVFRTFLVAAELTEMKREVIEDFLRRQHEAHPFFELMYVTDALGIQVTDNIWSDPDTEGTNAYGKNWVTRTWYLEAISSKSISISNIYRSVATGRFCFTISGPIKKDGLTVGVIAADIDFSSLFML